MPSYYFQGEKLPLHIEYHPLKRSRLEVRPDHLLATLCYDLSTKQQKEQVAILIEKLYRQALNKVARETIELLQKFSPRQVNRITIKKIRSRWGSASQDGNINFNLDLAKLPLRVQQYVIIHEYSHLFQMNHSPKFWAVVGQFDPNFRQHRRVLRQYEKELRLKTEAL